MRFEEKKKKVFNQGYYDVKPYLFCRGNNNFELFGIFIDALSSAL